MTVNSHLKAVRGHLRGWKPSKDGKIDTEKSQTKLKQIVDNLKKIETPELNSPARVLTGRTLLMMNCIKDGRIYLTKELSSKSHGAIAFRFLLEK